MLELLISLLVLAAVFILIAWALQQAGVPQPVLSVLWIIFALIVLLVALRYVPGLRLP